MCVSCFERDQGDLPPGLDVEKGLELRERVVMPMVSLEATRIKTFLLQRLSLY